MQRRVKFSGFYRLALVALSGVVGFAAVGRRPGRAEAADPNVLDGLYHEGVKSFSGGNYTRAADLLSTAIDAGSKDPRSFYYRGLSRQRLGRRTEADADFKRGAEIEGRDFDSFFNVSRSIERIQGSERLMLERYRAAGRKNALAEIEKIRFEMFRRFQPTAGVSGPATVDGGAPSAEAPADAAAPASTLGTPTLGTPATAPATPNPFGTPAAPPAGTPAAPGAPVNPFGGAAPAAPAAPSAPTTPPANPFGT